MKIAILGTIWTKLSDLWIGYVERSSESISSFFNNSANWICEQSTAVTVAIISLIATLIIIALFRAFAKKIVKKISQKKEDSFYALILNSLLTPISWLILILGLIFSTNPIDMPGQSEEWIYKVFYALFIIILFWSLFKAVDAIDKHFKIRLESTNSKMDLIVINLLRKAVKTLIWVIAILFIVQNVLNMDVSAIIASAGVAGIAVAFAAQNTISNIFGAISLIFDKTFKVGEFIKVNGSDGVVESLGFRSTVLRSLDGTIWKLPNRVVADSTIENVTERPNIKHTFTIGLVYSTTAKEMQHALDILQDIFSNSKYFDHTNLPPKFYFSELNAYSLDIEVILWFNTTDVLEFKEWKSDINFQILDRFNNANLSFAYPTTTNHLVSENKVNEA